MCAKPWPQRVRRRSRTTIYHVVTFGQSNGECSKKVVNCGCMPVVFSSSCATYAIPERVPIPEDHPQHPVIPYGSSKLFIERMLADLNVTCGLPGMALRYFNAAGADREEGCWTKKHDRVSCSSLTTDNSMSGRMNVRSAELLNSRD
jgi:UDP-glucose 4-epimerase